MDSLQLYRLEESTDQSLFVDCFVKGESQAERHHTLAKSWSRWDLSYHVRLGLFSFLFKKHKIIESI